MLAPFLLRWSKLNSVDFIGYLFYFKLCMLVIKLFAIQFNCLSPYVLWEWWFYNTKLHEYTVHNLRALWHSIQTLYMNLKIFVTFYVLTFNKLLWKLVTQKNRLYIFCWSKMNYTNKFFVNWFSNERARLGQSTKECPNAMIRINCVASLLLMM